MMEKSHKIFSAVGSCASAQELAPSGAGNPTGFTTAMEKGVFGQGSGEFIMLLAAMLTVALVSISLLMFFPNMAAESQLQKSQSFWADGKPFSVQGNTIYTTGMLLQMQNAEPVTVTITGISINGVALNLYNHSLPFTWTRTSACSAPGVCSILVYPGQTAAISTDEFADGLLGLCGSGDGFADGKIYSVNFSISYKTASGQSFTQTGTTQLMGKCTKGDVGLCNNQPYSMGNQQCCPDATPNYICSKGTQACGAGSCVVACNGAPYVSPNACCNQQTIYNTNTDQCCSDAGEYVCTKSGGTVCNSGTCGKMCGSIVKYTPPEICCQDGGNYKCNGQIGEVCNGGSCGLMCGSTVKYTPPEICCNNNGNYYKCPSSQVCNGDVCAPTCDGTTPYTPPGEACCGTSKYNTATQICCGGNVFSNSYSCCNNQAYNTATQKCCSSSYVCQSSQACYQGSCADMCGAQPIPQGKYCCGGKTIYDQTTHYCCTVQSKSCALTIGTACTKLTCGGGIDPDDI